jgi:peptidase E
MKLFLTSSIGGSYKENGIRTPCALDDSNQFLNNLKKDWPKNSKCMIISSDPDNEEINDSFKSIFKEAFNISGFSCSQWEVCDRRNESRLSDIIYYYDVIILAGGHVPTQNRFFSEIHLRELLKSFNGIVIGISAGSMNCADVVYAQPELDGEAINPSYQRYLDGLGITCISILPHYQDLKDISIDGLKVVEDISLPDSKIRPFYALVDGAYIINNNDIATLYGEAYYFCDGTITQVCDTDRSNQLQ